MTVALATSSNTTSLKQYQASVEREMDTFIVMRSNAPRESTVSLINWLSFHDIVPTLVRYESDMELKGRTLIITDDMVPSPHLVEAILQEKSALTDITITPNAEDEWRFSVILLFTTSIPRNASISTLLLGIVSPSTLVHDDRLSLHTYSTDFKEEVVAINKRMMTEHTLKSKYDVLSSVIVSYWYNVSNSIVSDYYIHQWILAYQKWSLSSIGKGSTPSKETVECFEWIRSQSFFCSLYGKQHVKGSIDWAISETMKSKLPLGSPLSGFVVEVDTAKARLIKHPLTLRGLYEVIPSSTEHEYDMSVTVVGFYYNLGYSDKPKSDYVTSIEKWCSVKHPLVFFGDREMCDLILSFRDPAFTVVIDKPIEEWSLISSYKQQFSDMSINGSINRSPRYAILTNLKVEAMAEAASLNHFSSSVYVWLDPGYFKHSHFVQDFVLGSAFFSSVQAVEGKISIPSITSIVHSTEEECINSLEQVLGYTMAGRRETWQPFNEKYRTFVKAMFDRGIFRTEQIIITRFCTLYPSFFNLIINGYVEGNLSSFSLPKDTCKTTQEEDQDEYPGLLNFCS